MRIAIARHRPLKGHELEAAKEHKIDVDTKSIAEVRVAIAHAQGGRGVANRAKYYNATEIHKAKTLFLLGEQGHPRFTGDLN